MANTFRNMNYKLVFKTIIIAWAISWIFFLVREDKDNQYGTLLKLIKSSPLEKKRIVYGEDLFDFLNQCKKIMGGESTFHILGLKKHSIEKVRTRYFLWPNTSDIDNADFKVLFNNNNVTGYKNVYSFKGKWNLLEISMKL